MNKISNKEMKKVIKLDLANYALKKYKVNFITSKMLKGVSNFQIEDAIKKNNNEDLNNNFVGVFPENKMNKFINFKQIIHEKSFTISFSNS